MKSIKPGRGPSFMGGIMSIAVGLFGLLWTVFVASSGGGAFALFGLIFIGIAVVQAIYNFKNATGKNRYSEYDITESGEEPDPWNERFGENKGEAAQSHAKGRYCPYCGAKAEENYKFCADCGRELP